MKLMYIALLCLMHFTLSFTTEHDNCCIQLDASTVDCSQCKLNHIPSLLKTNITSLNLNDNLIKIIDDDVFTNLTSLRYLTLRYNGLVLISDNSFVGLENLETLDITQEDGYSISLNAFKPLKRLKTLKLGKICTTSQCSFPKEAFAHLSTDLVLLELSVPPNFVFGPEFSHLEKLEVLVLQGRNCSLQNISSSTFSVFEKSLQELEVRNCGVTNLDSDTFKNFRKLETLNFACNRKLYLPGIFESIKKMSTTSLTTLIVDSILSDGDLLEILPEWFNSTRFENLKRLSMRLTHIVAVDFSVFYHIPRIEHLNFGYNTMQKFTTGDVNRLLQFLGQRNLTSIDMSFMGVAIGVLMMFKEKYCDIDSMYSEDFFQKPPPYIVVPDPVPCCNHSLVIDSGQEMFWRNVPQSLLYLYASRIGFPKGMPQDIILSPDNNVLYLDVSGTQIQRINRTFQGFEKLQGIDASGCAIEYIAPHVIDSLPSLRFFNLSENNLYKGLSDRLFRNAQSIRVLDLSSNRLQYIPGNIFKGLPYLEIALLQNNPVGKIFINLKNNDHLNTLDLRNTSLSFNTKFTDELDNLQSRLNHSLHLKLSGNIFQCDCENLVFLKWMTQTMINLVDRDILLCEYQKEQTPINAVDLDKLGNSCKDTTSLLAIILSPLASIVAILLLLLFIHNYKWSIQWKFYLLQRCIKYVWLNRYGDALQLDDCNSSHDAFVSYHHKQDYEWVQNVLLPTAENEWGLTLCVGNRDFIPGVPIAENICDAIDKSRYVILVITPFFVSSEWCDFEMHMALVKGRRHLIIIYKEEVDVNEMSKTLRSLMSSVNYIEYNTTPAGEELFWTRLRHALTTETDA